MASKLAANPLVSIVTPVFNGVKYLEACIQSVLNQGYSNIEQIFVDGGSTDGTLEMLADYQSRYPGRIRFVSERDEGVGEALNRGLKLAKGQIFGWLDSDDLYETDAIAAVVGFFTQNPEAYFVFGACDTINETGKLTGKHPVKDWDLKEAINDRHYIVMGAAFYRREVVEKAGDFNTLGNDLDFWLRVAQSFKMHRIQKTLYRQRQHGENVTFSKDSRRAKMNRDKYRQDYLLCRKYGGGIFAPRVRRYFIFVLLDKLRLYRFASTLLPRMKHNRLAKGAIIKLVGQTSAFD